MDTTKSYYKTWGESPGDNVGVSISELIDDADLMEYNEDSTFTAHPTPRTSDMPFYGRTMPEWTNNGGYGTSELYFVVDGSFSEAGTSFTITVTSMGGSLSIAHNEGSESDPVAFPSGYLDSASVATGGASYYRVAVTPGVSYRANSYASGDINLSIYTDQFVTLAGGPSIHSGPVTATGNFLFIKAEPAATGYDFSMEVVRAEGSNFTNPATPGTNGGTANETCGITNAGSLITIRIDNPAANGATYRLTVT
ncbi:MAG TPA: hypothetical protein VMX75_04605, partial [Spirochaetia bacterium]|nr:hypothetical protein [Spirochaetia bacterium]